MARYSAENAIPHGGAWGRPAPITPVPIPTICLRRSKRRAAIGYVLAVQGPTNQAAAEQFKIRRGSWAGVPPAFQDLKFTRTLQNTIFSAMHSPGKPSYWIEVEDWHTAGEPFRIVHSLPAGHLPASPTVAQRRADITATPGHPLDELRRLLCHEPRGHAGMYGGFITPPDDSGAHFGVLFWHRNGFSTACGHGTIALGYWALFHRIVAVPPDADDGPVDVVVDVPSGRVVARMAVEKGKPVHADFINVASFQLTGPLYLTLPSCGVDVLVDLAFAGAVYASVDAAQFGLEIEPGNAQRFVQLAREVEALLGTRARYGSYGLYGVIFFSEEENGPGATRAIYQRNVTIFADGEVDRSPCGSGTCARLALLLAQGKLGPGSSRLVHRSIIASTFEADIVSAVASPVDGFAACIPRVRGRANLVGQTKFFIDPDDEVFPGFLL
ncbi:Trans-3-hydroxy-L-proline dehydratase [Metarhizium anisopliae]